MLVGFGENGRKQLNILTGNMVKESVNVFEAYKRQS